MLGRQGEREAAGGSSLPLAGFLVSDWPWLGGRTPGRLKASSRLSTTGEDPCKRPVNCSGTPAA